MQCSRKVMCPRMCPSPRVMTCRTADENVTSSCPFLGQAPLPKQWHTLPLVKVIELAVERGYAGGVESRMEAVKFLRAWAKQHSI